MAFFFKLRELLRWRVGEWVEIRSAEEILSTLDNQATLDALPFMPEMLKYCGKRFRIIKSAHKTCDPTGKHDLRRMKDTVHLEMRCDGAAHGGCQAGCLFFWKKEWLKLPSETGAHTLSINPPCTYEALQKSTRRANSPEDDIIYRCQITEIVRASSNLTSMEPWQYVQDLLSRNITLSQLLVHIPLALLKNVKVFLRDTLLARARTMLTPQRNETTGNVSIPLPPLGLQIGETVQIRSRKEILATLGKTRKNLGLSFDSDMARNCGEVRKVLQRVTRIIDERTGKMLNIKRDCIVLDGVICKGLDCRKRLFCPRGAYTFWREGWLTRYQR